MLFRSHLRRLLQRRPGLVGDVGEPEAHGGLHEPGPVALVVQNVRLQEPAHIVDRPDAGRAPDYDDWELNGDIIFRNTVLDRAFEVSSMGIRVSPESMDRQLTLAGCDERRSLPFHKALLAGEMPFTMGGGIGQSRLCMLLIGCAHIGEVQSGVWDEETVNLCKARGVHLL